MNVAEKEVRFRDAKMVLRKMEIRIKAANITEIDVNEVVGSIRSSHWVIGQRSVTCMN